MFAELEGKIKTLTETAWLDRHLDWSEVEKWLAQFEDDAKIEFLFLLSNFMYFGRREVKEMLRSLYRDIYKYPLIAKLRRDNNNTKDRDFLEAEFQKQLENTRFLGIGNPSESGTHLLYFFRQENKLPNDLFINGHEIFHRDLTQQKISIKNSNIERYIFLDDLTCSGSQAIDYSQEFVGNIKAKNSKAKVCYFVLFATEHALEEINKHSSFDEIKGLFELDSSFKCFEDNSRYYRNAPSNVDKNEAERFCFKYDTPLSHNISNNFDFVLGFQKSQLLLSFYHNTPDNVPPVFWYDGLYTPEKQWREIFKRYHKVY